MLLRVYALPMGLVLALIWWAWWRGPQGSFRLEPWAAALAIVVGFCALEERWPWELHSPWRVHYGIPVAMIVFGVLASALAARGRLRWGEMIAIAVLVVAILVWMLGEYAFKWNEDWSRSHHAGLFIALLGIVVVQVWGQMGLARVLPAPCCLTALGFWLLTGIVYAFTGASSLKVAQWLGIAGIVVAAMVILAFFQRSRLVGRGVVALIGFFGAATLLYGFYFAREPQLLSLFVWLAWPAVGLWWAFREREVALSGKASWALTLGSIVAAGCLIALIQVNQPAPAEEDELDYYSYRSAS